MRPRIRWNAILICCAAACGPLGAQQRRESSAAALRDTLVGVWLDFSAGWEPQSGTEVDAIARGRKHFVTDSTFAMVIDATYRASYDQWAARTAVSIPNTYRGYSEQRHHVSAARLLPLSDRAAALTIVYCVDFVRVDGSRGTANSAATLVFIRKPDGWKIAQYHGSHGPETVTDVRCPTG